MQFMFSDSSDEEGSSDSVLELLMDSVPSVFSGVLSAGSVACLGSSCCVISLIVFLSTRLSLVSAVKWLLFSVIYFLIFLVSVWFFLLIFLIISFFFIVAFFLSVPVFCVSVFRVVFVRFVSERPIVLFVIEIPSNKSVFLSSSNFSMYAMMLSISCSDSFDAESSS